MNRYLTVTACLVVYTWLAPSTVHAATTTTLVVVAPKVVRIAPFGLPDEDKDGLPDVWENSIFGTNPSIQDTDADGHDDWAEIIDSFNPNGKGNFAPKDLDKDGLNDVLELRFGTDPMIADTDLDGHGDGEEVSAGFSPTSTSLTPLQKKIVVHLKTQRLDQVLGGVTIATRVISSGKASTPTPVGEFKVLSKNKRAWSKMAGLWMPFWMQFTAKGAGLHELPEWPGGHKEGAAHLGTPVSHGCVRLGIGPAQELYNWTPIGTPVQVVRL